LWPSGLNAALLVDDKTFNVFVYGDQRLPFHLVVDIPQVGGAIGVSHDAVVGNLERVGHPQAAAHEDERDEVPQRVVPPAEVDGILELGHHVFGQCAG
jgi:hypothetical protein